MWHFLEQTPAQPLRHATGDAEHGSGLEIAAQFAEAAENAIRRALEADPANPEALDALVGSLQRHVTGSVRMRLYKGGVQVLGRSSPGSLYHEGLATFGADDVYRQSDAEGFIRLYGLAVRTAAERERRSRVQLAEAAD